MRRYCFRTAANDNARGKRGMNEQRIFYWIGILIVCAICFSSSYKESKIPFTYVVVWPWCCCQTGGINTVYRSDSTLGLIYTDSRSLG